MGEGKGDRGFRLAEHVLAAATEIGADQAEYLQAVAEQPQRESCRAARNCEFVRNFPISVGVRTRVEVTFWLKLSPSGRSACEPGIQENACYISAADYSSGDERFPQCVGVGPILKAAVAAGWRAFPFHQKDWTNDDRYQHISDASMYMFIRRLRDRRCVHSVSITRIPPVHSLREN